MARLVKSSGRKIFFRYGGDAVRTRMYRSWSQMKEGWTKNLAVLFKRPRALAFVRASEFLLIFGNLIGAIAAVLTNRLEVASVTFLLSFVVAASAWARIRRAHFSFVENLLALGALAVFAYFLFRSTTLHRNSAVTWKGRQYGVAESPHTKSWGAVERDRLSQHRRVTTPPI